jgi:hypothetical protein
LYINDTSQVIGVNLALDADTCLYATERKESYVQRGLGSMAAWCKSWKIKIYEEKTREIYFCHQIRPPETTLTLN